MRIPAYAAHDTSGVLQPHTIERRALRDDDVAIRILYCGVCHSDLHTARNDWGWTHYPIVPGHEIVGEVIATGPAVTRHRIGDRVAVGCMVDSCLHCDQCENGEEQLCREGSVGTYAGRDRIDQSPTHGGYSSHIVVREQFCLRVPDGLDLARAAPLLCAGITTWSPLRTWQAGPGTRVGIIGLGGLGHMAVKLAAGLGAEVTVISRDRSKTADALALGAHRLLDSSNPDALRAEREQFDLILDTVPVNHSLKPYLPLLDHDGTLVLLGHIGALEGFNTSPLLFGRRRIAGSPIGGIRETQEMLDFCAAHNILPECELIPIQDINQAYARMEQADVRYRFVIDMASLPALAD